MTNSYSKLNELRERLDRYDGNERPVLPGPTVLHSMFLHQRQRELRNQIKSEEKRLLQWKAPKTATCKGPSAFKMLGANLASYVCVCVVGISCFCFLIYISGIWAAICWVYRGVKTIISYVSSVVSHIPINYVSTSHLLSPSFVKTTSHLFLLPNR